jgi:ERCC4-related helicase
MYDLETKKKLNPIFRPLISLSDSHKESVISLFIVLAGSDQHITKGITEKEFAYINKYTEIFKLKNEFSILEKSGINGVINYLKELDLAQRASLILLTWQLLGSDEKPNETEILDMKKILNQVGISTEQIVETIRLINF